MQNVGWFARNTRVWCVVLLLSVVGCGGNPTQPLQPYYTTVSGSVSSYALANHTVSPSRGGAATITLTWNSSFVDLDLYVTSTACSTYPVSSTSSACAYLANSARGSGTSEVATFTVSSGQSFKIWVDNYSGSSSNYSISVSVS